MHGNFEQIPFAFLVGLGIGFAVEKCADSLLDDGGHGTTWFIIARKA
jgi:hypothetical protein